MISESPMTEQTLDQLQRAAFSYFLQAVSPANGLIADTSRDNSPAGIGVVGFALSAYPVAVERGWMTRAMRSNALSRRYVSSATAIKAAVRRQPVTKVSTTTFSTCRPAFACGARSCR